MPFRLAMIINPEVLIGMLATVKSPFFCEFVLELSGLTSHFDPLFSEGWDRWKEIDRFLEEKFAKRADFKVVIRTGSTHDQALFQKHSEGGFPLLVRRECVHFET